MRFSTVGRIFVGFVAVMCFELNALPKVKAISIADFNVTSTTATTGFTVDNASGSYPIVTAVISTPIGAQPGGGNFTRYVFLAQDSSGGVDIFGPTTQFGANGALPGGYIPQVGDAISFTAESRPFSNVPEASFATTQTNAANITLISHNNPVPAPLLETIPVINSVPPEVAGNPPTNIQPWAGKLLQVNNVTIIPNGGTYGNVLTNTRQVSYKIASGHTYDNNEDVMTMFFDASNYSVPYVNYINATIPSTPVSIQGIVQFFASGNVNELLPMNITPYVAPAPTGQVFWRPSGNNGGAGNWNTNQSNWNTASDGSGTQGQFTTTSFAAFGGAGNATVTIDSPGVTSNGVEFDSTGYVVTGAPLTLGSFGTSNTSNNNTVSVANAGDTATISAPIQGSSGLQKIGAGTLILTSTDTANNNFTGGVKISAGVLQISDDANLGDPSNFVRLSGGTLKINAGSTFILGSGRTILGVGGSIDIGNGNQVTVPGPVTMLGGLGIPSTETVTLTNSIVGLGGVNFTGNGTLQIGTGGTGSAFMAGAIVDSNSTGTATIQAATLKYGFDTTNGNSTTLGGTISVTNPGATLAITGSLNTAQVASGTHIIVNGAGTVDLPHSQDTTFNKAWQIGGQGAPGPTLNVYSANNLGGNTSDQTFFNSGTINNLSGGTLIVGTNISYSIGGTVGFPSSFAGGNQTYSGAISLFRPTGTGQSQIGVAPGTTVSFTGGWNATDTTTQIGDSGTFANTSGLVVNGGGTLNLSASTGNFNFLTVPITADGATVNFNGTDPNANGAKVFASGSTTVFVTTNLGLSATNGGHLNLLAANAFQGGASPATATAAAVSVSNGGTVGTGGLNQTFNTISVGGIGVLDLGATKASPPAVVTFANSSAATWAASGGVGPFLRVSDWKGSISGGSLTGDQVMVGSGGLSPTQLGEVHFTGFLTGSQILGSGELVPAATSTPIKLGDVNQDGVVSVDDVSAMMAALSDLTDYESGTLQFPGTSTFVRNNHTTPFDLLDAQDALGVSGNGSITNAVLQAEISLIATHGGLPSLAAVPEPTSWLLLGIGGLIAMGCQSRRKRRNVP